MNKKEQKEFNQKVVTLLNEIVYGLNGATRGHLNEMMVKVTQLQGLLEK